MKVVSSEQMKSIDKTTISEIGISGLTLMENAGINIVNILFKKINNLHQKRICIICGKGNNGGDGLVIARHLFNRNICVEVILLSEKKLLSQDTLTNYEIAKKLNIKINDIKSIKEISNYTSKIIKASDIVIDAILGTGLTSEVTGFYKEAIKLINSSGKSIISIDIPSGISSNTGKIIGEHVNAELTITIGMPKIGNVIYPAAEFSGDLTVCDIGLPKKIIIDQNIKVETTEKKDFKDFFKKRAPNSYKGTFGHTFIISGSYGKGGASAMASLSALRVGAGLVTLALPEKMSIALEMEIPEVITFPLPQTESGSLDITARKEILKNLKDKAVVLIGPGLSTDPSTTKVVSNILQSEELECPVVLDADGINSVVGNTNIIKNRPYPLILTPHPGEMARLMEISTKEVQADRLNIARTFSKEHNVYTILKGANTIIATPKEDIFINISGNPGIATAGSGDVLAGIISGILAQGFPLLESLKVAVFLHGMSGDIAKEHVGEESLIATDIIKYLPKAIKEIKNN